MKTLYRFVTSRNNETMREIKVTHKTTTDCIDDSEVFLDISVASNDKIFTLVIYGEIWAHYKKHKGDFTTPAYDELIDVCAVCTDLIILDPFGNQVPEFMTEFNQESESILQLLTTYCYEEI